MTAPVLEVQKEFLNLIYDTELKKLIVRFYQRETPEFLEMLSQNLRIKLGQKTAPAVVRDVININHNGLHTRSYWLEASFGAGEC